MIPFGLALFAAFGLDTRQLELLSQNLSELFHGQIDFKDVAAGRVTGLSVAVFIHIAGCERLAWFAFTLTDAAGVAAAETEVRHFDLGNRNADEILPLLAD